MKIMGLATYVTHKWRVRAFLKTRKKCEIKLLQHRSIDRPFLANPIKRPMKFDNKIEKHSARDTKTLIKL